MEEPVKPVARILAAVWLLPKSRKDSRVPEWLRGGLGYTASPAPLLSCLQHAKMPENFPFCGLGYRWLYLELPGSITKPPQLYLSKVLPFLP